MVLVCLLRAIWIARRGRCSRQRKRLRLTSKSRTTAKTRSESLSSPCTRVDSVRDSLPRKEVTLMTLSKTTRAGRSKEAKARKQLTTDQFFFYQNAGYSYDTKTETPEQG